MRWKIIAGVIGAFLLIVPPIHSSATQAGAIFLAIYPGARPNGMGTAFTAIADDAMAVYYNDAGMAFQNETNITLMHASWLSGLFPGMYYQYLGFVHEFEGIGKIGGNIIYLTTGKTDATGPGGELIGRFSSFDLAAKLSYATKISDNLAIGIGGKFIYSHLVPTWILAAALPGAPARGGGTGVSWAVDLSAFYKSNIEGLNLGIALQNLGPNISFIEGGESDPLPRTLRFGVAYTPIDTRMNKLTGTAEITKILVGVTRNIRDEWNDTWKAIGAEYTLSELFTLRAGYFWDTVGERVGPTFGGGIRLGNLRFDIGVDSEIYAFPTDNYRFSLFYSF